MGTTPVKNLVIAVTLLTTSSNASAAQPVGAASAINGLWDATIVANDTEVPFRFEIVSSGGAETEGFFFEGDRKVGSTAGSFVGRVLTLEYEFLDRKSVV